MSFTATKPSPSWTWSASATSLQKRQSGCDTDNPLFTHLDRADADELTDGRVDEPRRIVVAVAPSGAVDENDIGRSDLLAPAAPARLARCRAQSRASILLHGRRNAVLVGRRRPGPGRVRKDVHLRDARGFDRCHRVLEGSAVLRRKADNDVRRQVEALRLRDAAQIRA